jgi:hypothetical protein
MSAKGLLGKVADAAETNEDSTQLSVNNLWPSHAGRRPGTLDAKWGDPSPSGVNDYPDVYSSAVMREAKDGRANLLERLFDSPRTSSPAEQALMSEHFENAREGAPHSPMLQRGRLPLKVAHADETLTDQVMRVIGFR